MAALIAGTGALGIVYWQHRHCPVEFSFDGKSTDRNQIGLYLSQFKKDCETTLRFRNQVKFPDFCAKDWKCLSDEASAYPVHTVGGAMTMSSDFVTYSQHRKTACMGDAKCEQGVVAKFFSALTGVFSSLNPKNLFAYQVGSSRSTVTHFIRLQEDALAIHFFNSMSERFSSHAEDLRKELSPEEFSALYEIYADLPRYPEDHQFLVSKLSEEEIEGVFREAQKESIDGKDIPRLRKILLTYKRSIRREPAGLKIPEEAIF